MYHLVEQVWRGREEKGFLLKAIVGASAAASVDRSGLGAGRQYPD
jgi:hypothetical protein